VNISDRLLPENRGNAIAETLEIQAEFRLA